MNAIDFQYKVKALNCFSLSVTKGIWTGSTKLVISTNKLLGKTHFKAIAKLGRYVGGKFEITACEEEFQPDPTFDEVLSVLERAAASNEQPVVASNKKRVVAKMKRSRTLTDEEIVDIYGCVEVYARMD